MMRPPLKSLWISLGIRLRQSRFAMFLRRPYRRFFRKLEDSGIGLEHELAFLRNAKGLIHVGAHEGQEAWIYDLMDLKVHWFEPNPMIYKRLCTNLGSRKKQVAHNDLITDCDGAFHEFHITDNDGGSSSIFRLAGHREMYPGIEIANTIVLKSKSLDQAAREYKIGRKFDALVMDTQGSELLILKGASKVLEGIRWIFAECADFEAYEGACVRSDLEDFLSEKGFVLRQAHVKNFTGGVGTYYDVLWERA